MNKRVPRRKSTRVLDGNVLPLWWSWADWRTEKLFLPSLSWPHSPQQRLLYNHLLRLLISLATLRASWTVYIFIKKKKKKIFSSPPPFLRLTHGPQLFFSLKKKLLLPGRNFSSEPIYLSSIYMLLSSFFLVINKHFNMAIFRSKSRDCLLKGCCKQIWYHRKVWSSSCK